MADQLANKAKGLGNLEMNIAELLTATLSKLQGYKHKQTECMPEGTTKSNDRQNFVVKIELYSINVPLALSPNTHYEQHRG